MESVGITTHRPLAGYDSYVVGVHLQRVEVEPGGEFRQKKTWDYRIPADKAQDALRQFSEDYCTKNEALEWIGKVKDGLRRKRA